MSVVFEPERGFGVYVHWPYCTRICPYCDFNVYAAKSRDNDPLLEAIVADLRVARELTGTRRVDTIFFGGGTPSLLPPRDVEQIIETIAGLWTLSEQAEISLEANPEDVRNLAGLAVAGVNRLSLGVQSLNDAELHFLGRNHDTIQALEAFKVARKHFHSVSLDFIYALPGQPDDVWQQGLKEILSLGADHLSLYELTIEERTAFAKAVERGVWQPADQDRSADLYELTQDLTSSAGYPAYEISNHARSTEHQAQHNKIYWRSGDWVGVGPGAHGRLTVNGVRKATIAPRGPSEYIARMLSPRSGPVIDEALSLEDVAVERLIMGLRLQSGLHRSEVEVLLGRPLNSDAISDAVMNQWLELSDGLLRLTQTGRLLADLVSRSLLSLE